MSGEGLSERPSEGTIFVNGEVSAWVALKSWLGSIRPSELLMCPAKGFAGKPGVRAC